MVVVLVMRSSVLVLGRMVTASESGVGRVSCRVLSVVVRLPDLCSLFMRCLV